MAKINKLQISEDAAKQMLHDIVWLLDGTMENADIERYRNPQPELKGAQLVELLNRNFDVLDPNNNGISRDELVSALLDPKAFSADEYLMLKMIAKFFDTIINLSDDEPGEESVITRTDGEVLAQFLVHSNLTLAQLHSYMAVQSGTATEKDIGPPPLSGA